MITTGTSWGTMSGGSNKSTNDEAVMGKYQSQTFLFDSHKWIPLECLAVAIAIQ